jgi:50S ribosomal protein L16 3-hydroxylase
MEMMFPTPLLGGLSPHVFMRRHWQKKPLLIRQASADSTPWITRSQLFEIASRDDVESRLVVRNGAQWRLRQGPFARRSLPAVSKPDWTMLVQGLDLHLDAAHALLSKFRFVPDARLDDLMVSWASEGGGVGPHVDSYDVFLLQLQGRRRWRIGPMKDATIEPGLPLRILKNFEPEQEWLLEPGDMLYLPPRWAHDGVAQGECMTASIGFRAAPRGELGREILQRLLDDAEMPDNDPLYRDPRQIATAQPARVPEALQNFAADAVERFRQAPHELKRALGEALSEPKRQVWFDAGEALEPNQAVALDRRTKMLYDDHHVFINGESFRAGGRDARLMNLLADERRLSMQRLAQLSTQAFELLSQWSQAGWLRAGTPTEQD